MPLPVAPVRKPAVLHGQQNGRLDPAILVTVPGLDGGPEVRLVAPAARAWEAMTAAAARDGIILKAVGLHDSYRPYATQERIFRQRYTTTRLSGRPSRVWNGVRWWQKPGTAPAAVPGDSNHGWALAVDTGVERDSDPAAESIDQRALDWLKAHAHEFGFSWELQSEPWHLRYVAGDNPPPAVTGAAPPPDTSTTDEELIDMLAKSTEDARKGEVRRLYLELLHRQPTPKELGDGVNTVDRMGYEALVASIADSDDGKKVRAAQRKLLGLAP